MPKLMGFQVMKGSSASTLSGSGFADQTTSHQQSPHCSLGFCSVSGSSLMGSSSPEKMRSNMRSCDRGQLTQASTFRRQALTGRVW